MKNITITRLVTGFSLRERRNDPAKAGFVKASGIGLVPICYAATKPKAYLAGFFALWPDRLSGSGEFCRAKTIRDSAPDATISQSNTPQSGLAHGPTWAALKKHRHCIHPQARRPAFLSGTDQDLGPTVETSPFRVNDSLKGLWVAEQDSASGSGRESQGFHPCQTYGEKEMDDGELIEAIDKLRRTLRQADTQAMAIDWMAKAHELLGIAATKIEKFKPATESLIYLPRAPKIEVMESGLSPVRLFDVPTYIVPDMKPLYHRMKAPQDLRPRWCNGETVVYGDRYKNQAWTRKDTRRLEAEIKTRSAK